MFAVGCATTTEMPELACGLHPVSHDGNGLSCGEIHICQLTSDKSCAWIGTVEIE